MSDQHPQDQPQPNPPQDWNEVSAREIEKTISDAADLAYELAGDIGGAGPRPAIRDTSGLESIETALDVELKQLEHLVSRAKEELDEKPAAEAKRNAAVPDFMSEFLSDDPVATAAETGPASGGLMDDLIAGSTGGTHGAAPSGGAGTMTTGVAPGARAGLIGVGTLGDRPVQKKEKAEKAASEEAAKKKPGMRESMASAIYRMCSGGVSLLELADLPFGKMGPGTRRALSVTAVTAFCVCLAVFVLAMLFS